MVNLDGDTQPSTGDPANAVFPSAAVVIDQAQAGKAETSMTERALD